MGGNSDASFTFQNILLFFLFYSLYFVLYDSKILRLENEIGPNAHSGVLLYLGHVKNSLSDIQLYWVGG